MARDASYKVPRRRRREGKTDYYKRYEMVKNRHIRVVVRRTNKYIIVQFVYPTPIGDYTLAAAHSRELVKYFGWRAGTKSTPAAYLTGFLAGLRASKLGITYAIPDIGLHRPVKYGRVFAAIKGVRDAGVTVPCDEEMLPPDERVRGEVIANYAKLLSESNPEKFAKQFSVILRNGLDPRELPKHFEEVYNNILKAYSSIQESAEAKTIIENIVYKPQLGGT